MATYQIPTPDPMRVSGNVSHNWAVFRESYQDFANATELAAKPDGVQVSALKSIMGADCKRVLSQILNSEEQTSAAVVLDRLEAHFQPARNVMYERHEFFKADQLPNETLDQYIVRLRHLASTCGFTAAYQFQPPAVGHDDPPPPVTRHASYEDQMIRDRLVFGCMDKDARRRVFRDSDISLEKAIEIIRVSEVSKAQMAKMGMEREANFMRKKYNNDSKFEKTEKPKGRPLAEKPTQKVRRPRQCRFCKTAHVWSKELCPAWGKTCRVCKKDNHFPGSIVCKGDKAKKVHHVGAVEEESPDDDAFIYYMNSNKSSQFLVSVNYHVADGITQVTTQLDTGATCNAMSYDTLCEILHTKDVKLGAPSGTIKLYDQRYVIVPKGTYSLEVSLGEGASHLVVFDIVPNAPWPIISGNVCAELGWVKLSIPDTIHSLNRVACAEAENIIKEYDDIFDDQLGCIGTYNIEVDPTVRPVQHAPRRVPVALRARVKDKLTELEKRGVIAKVTEPTEWISSSVVVDKPGKLRLCMDPRDLNKAIKRPKYPMTTLDDILPRLTKAKVFSVLDAKDGFHQVKLTEESSFLTTHWTVNGRYRYLRMPFGISSAPEEFQRRLHEIVDGLDGVASIADDLLIYGCGETIDEAMEDHNNVLRSLCQRARERCLKLNKKKLKLCLTEVPFMGFRLTPAGVIPDPKKVSAIQDMPAPQDKRAVKRLLGTVQYLGKFVPQLSEVCEPLHRLTDKDTLWCWESSHQEAFDAVKKLISTAPTLRYYDVMEPVTVQCDASEHGLGAVLLQGGQPVAFASRTLTPTERNYAQIEKECLGIVYGCEKFSQYLLGRQDVEVETDHKPLVPIFSKSLLAAPQRLQRMLLRLQRFSLSLTYKKGSEMFISDMLSRAALPMCEKSDSEDHNFEIFALQLSRVDHTAHVRISDPKLQEIRNITRDDVELSTLKRVVLAGWPEQKTDVPACVAEYYNYRDEITVQDGVLFKGNRVIIPKALRHETVVRVHSSHQGAEACCRKARDVVFWPGYSADIKAACEECDICRKYTSHNIKEPMQSVKIPDLPWQIVSQDIFTYGKRDYLLTVDHYSDYIEVDVLPDTTAETVVKCTVQHFARHGIPERVITDNGPQFTSAEYAAFASKWEFHHATSSPYHSQGNGKAESGVKVAKMLLKKASADGKSFYLSLLDYRNTPTEVVGVSPAQRLMSRRTRTLLPTAAKQLCPEVQDPELIKDKIRLRRQRAKLYYDQGAKPLPDLEEGQSVLLQPQAVKTPWESGACLGRAGDRSYLVKTSGGSVLRRNRKFIRPRPNESSAPIEVQTPAPIPPVVSLPPAQPATPARPEASPSPKDSASHIEQSQELCAKSPQVVRSRSGRPIKVPVRLDM